ncbi:sugar isomerase domain-containing protein [Kibdelosporangium persicum]|uniref:Sugar isomerase domain-containing protein n=1 Tax=Kibdelosporangium persicum TaxID=2698649 RepID=A0ABX2F872_9PSEU|nr:sugar isomerase domain-containing protein [Kibdelosporangium persicum]NRN67551.1 Sugar isomerase domain-containing protein [Kibdelosporangium persicum]
MAVFGNLVRDHLSQVEKHNADALDNVADLFLGSIQAGGLILSGGAGHSLAAVAETFYRAGGLACVYPLYHPQIQPLHGGRASTSAERLTGLADEVFGKVELSGHDVLVVFSTSGVNPYPVELAIAAQNAGMPVVAVTSSPANAVAPRRADTTLAENASIVLDTLVAPGDSSYPPEAPVTAALSTVANAFLWAGILARLVDKGAAKGVEIPLWRSSNVPGGDEANQRYLDLYGPRVPQL